MDYNDQVTGKQNVCSGRGGNGSTGLILLRHLQSYVLL